MRNAIDIGNDFIITTDNSGGIGEKPGDVISVSDHMTAFFAARVTLLEQWAANAEPVTILIHNFSGSESWEKYVQGVEDLFQEAGLEIPTITGSSETNMDLTQSAVAVTMIGKKNPALLHEDVQWFTYGTPLVGNEVTEHANKIANLRKIREAMDIGIVKRLWPVGSRGILAEAREMTRNDKLSVESVVDVVKSAGPATVVIVGIPTSKINNAYSHFGGLLNELYME
ncbi:hypothetical protein JSQ81_15145 [Sporosarcina sp. Marseille-Q4063]|uniref:hypothetical protein n=1 Tax=Sporosarcina sp. Marseille-Q4063 TaxID=2810514 RepID=UPI001BAEF89B|nr:hypothetical protein [Sporosarcina sp. Marseille-Q4063]QUW21135.1 hypothetical protein JSQ81_15145 [Sporosarcina sp. Marseille-Q4063]